MDTPSSPQPEHPPTMQWRDAQGQTWDIQPSKERLTLTKPDEEVTLPREEWDARIDYNDVAGRIVFRFDVGDRQVGFMVSDSEGNAFLKALNWTHRLGMESAARLQSLTQRPHNWPTVTPWPVVGLFAAAASFVPLIGFGFAVLAIACILISLHQARRNQRLIHVPIIAVLTAIICVVATTANVLALVTWYSGSQAESLPPFVNVTDEISVAGKIIAVLMVLLSLSVHEASHAVTAWWCGDSGPLQRGRVTLNPIAHIDPIGTVLVPAVLAYWGGTIFGWAKPVMVTLHGVPNPRRANIIISAAGPLSNFLLGLIFLALYLILGCLICLLVPQAQVMNFTYSLADVHIQGFAGADYVAMAAICLKWGFIINFILCFFNLIPIPPLDGGHVLGSLFPRTVGAFYRKLGSFSLIIFLGLIYTGIIEVILAPGMILILVGFILISGITGL